MSGKIRAVPVNGKEMFRLRKIVKKMTLKALAEASGLSLSQLRRMEKGDTADPDASIQPVADALGVELGTLVVGEIPPPPQPYIKDDPLFPLSYYKDKAFNQANEADDVNPLLLFYRTEYDYISYVGIRMLDSILIDFVADQSVVWKSIVSLLEGDIQYFGVTALYLSKEYSDFLETGPPVVRGFQGEAGQPFLESFLRHITPSAQCRTLDDGTTVLSRILGTTADVPVNV